MNLSRTALQEVSADGAFVRGASNFRNFISSDTASKFRAEGNFDVY